MPEPETIEKVPADVATEADVKAVETKVEKIEEDNTEPPWLSGLTERIADAVFDRTKSYAETLLKVQEAAVEAVASGANEVVDTTQEPVVEEEQEEDIKPKRSHRLLHKRGVKKAE